MTIRVVFLKAMQEIKQSVFDILRMVINFVLLYNSPRIFYASPKQQLCPHPSQGEGRPTLWKALTYCVMNLLRSSDEASVIKREELTTSRTTLTQNRFWFVCLLL